MDVKVDDQVDTLKDSLDLDLGAGDYVDDAEAYETTTTVTGSTDAAATQAASTTSAAQPSTPSSQTATAPKPGPPPPKPKPPPVSLLRAGVNTFKQKMKENKGDIIAFMAKMNK